MIYQQEICIFHLNIILNKIVIHHIHLYRYYNIAPISKTTLY